MNDVQIDKAERSCKREQGVSWVVVGKKTMKKSSRSGRTGETARVRCIYKESCLKEFFLQSRLFRFSTVGNLTGMGDMARRKDKARQGWAREDRTEEK